MDTGGVPQPQQQQQQQLIENSNNNSSSTNSNNNNNSSNSNNNSNVAGVGAAELAAVAEELSKTAAKVESVELALSGGSGYLGITDKDKLLHQLEVLQTKEAQLQKKELLLMAAAAASATSMAAAAAAIGLIPGLTVAGNPLPLPAVANLAPHLHNNPAVTLRNANGDSEAPAIGNAMGTKQHHVPFETANAIDTNPHHLTPAPAPSDSSQPPSQPSQPPPPEPSQPIPTQPSHPPPPQSSQPDPPESSPDPATAAPAPAPSPSLLQGHLPAPVLARGPGTGNVPENGVGDVSASGAQHGVVGDMMAGTGGMGGVLHPGSSAASGIGQHQHHAGEGGVGGMEEQGGGHPGFVGVIGIINSASVSQGVGMTGGGHATGEHNANGGGVDAGLSVLGDVTLAPVKRRANKSLDGMEPEGKRRSRVSAQCQHPGCTTARTFGREGDKHASFCSVHKHEGMVNIKGRRCNVPGCQHRPGFAMPGDKRGKYCATHKEHGMIDVVSRKCQSEGVICDRQPVYGWPGERATRCGTHKLERTLTNLTTGATRVEKMYDVRGKRCQEHGCMRQPGFGDPLRDKGPVRCNEHKLEGMTNVRKRRALDKIHKGQHHHEQRQHQQQQYHGISAMDYHHEEPNMSHHGPAEIPQHHHTHGSALGSEGLSSPSSYGAAVAVPSSYIHAGRHHSPPRHSLLHPTLNSTPPMGGGGYPPYSSAPEGVSSSTLTASTAAGVSTTAVAAESSSAGMSATGHHPDYGSGSPTSSDPATGMPSHHHEHERHHGHHSQPPNFPTNHHEYHEHQQQQHHHHHHHHHQGAVLANHHQHHHTPTHYTTDQPEHTHQPHHHEHEPHHHEHQPHQSSSGHAMVHHRAPQAHSHQAPPPESSPAHAPDHDNHPFYDEVAANSPNLGVPTSPLDGGGRREGGVGGMVGEGGGDAAPEDEEHGEDVNVGDEGATLEVLAQAAHSSSIAQ